MFAVKQREDKSLRSFINYFTIEMLEIHNWDETTVVSTMRSGMKFCSFYFFLKKRNPKTLAKLLSLAKRYIKVKEAIATWREEIRDRRG